MRRIFSVSLVLAGLITAQALAEDTLPDSNEARRTKVVATVGATTITVGELEDMINARSPYARKRLTDPEALKGLVDQRVKDELFYQGAEKLGYADDPVVRRFLDQTLVQFYVQKEYEEAVTPDSVSDEDVAKYYQEHYEDFRQAEMRRARHILVASKDEAEDVLRQLGSGDPKLTFRALAKQLSLDTETKLRGGDLLYFNADGALVGQPDGARIEATLAKAAFDLGKTGELSTPLDLGDGQWSILELTGIRPEKIQTVEQASGLIRRKIWRQEREATLDKAMADLRAELKPEIFPERMDAIVLGPVSGPIEHPKQ